MHGTTPLDHLISNALVKVRVDSFINAAQLQRRLAMPIDALHLCLEAKFQIPRVRILPHDQKLAITD